MDPKDHVVPCTWADCSDLGTIEQRDKNGDLWATLCVKHSTELDAAVANFSPKEMLRAWVKASGGAEKMTKRMPVDEIARTAETLMMGGRTRNRAISPKALKKR